MRLHRLLLRLSPALALAACTGAVPTRPAPAGTADLAADYAALADGPGTVYRADPAASDIRIYVYRGGAAARAGHNHVLTVPAFEGYARYSAQSPDDSRCDLRLRFEDLRIDDPDVRRETGGSFAKPLSESDIDGTRRHMLGKKGFEADRFPEIALHCVAVHGEFPRPILQLQVRLHGAEHELWVPVEAQADARSLRVQGAFALRHSDFGLEPYSVLGGLMAVQDAIAIHFDLRLEAVGQTPQPAA